MKRYRLPHKVRIGNRTVNIHYKHQVLSDNGEELAGQCVAPQESIEISLSDNTTRKLILSTLWHEVLHYVLYYSGQCVALERVDMEREEGVVLALENVLFGAVNWKASMWKDWKLVKVHP
jgi:hypothetical protein